MHARIVSRSLRLASRGRDARFEVSDAAVLETEVGAGGLEAFVEDATRTQPRNMLISLPSEGLPHPLERSSQQ